LVGHNKQGEPDSVRYEQINAMLLNEFLKEHRKVQDEEAAVAQLKSTVSKEEEAIAEQQKAMKATIARLEEHSQQIEKVSAQVKMNSRAARVASNRN
jgi:hypothetical protein